MKLVGERTEPREFALKLIAFAAVLLAAGPLASQATSSPAMTQPSPTPMPSARDCQLFKQLHPPTKAAFDKLHLSARQRAYVLKYVKQIPAANRTYARWMLDRDVDEFLVIFDASPVRPDDAIGSHAAWTALNTNEALDPIECHTIIMPVAAM